MGSPRSGGSASSGKHVDCGSDGGGSSGELLGTFNADEVDVDLLGHRGGHWCSGWLVCVLGSLLALAGLDGTPGGIGGGAGFHPDSSSTAAESFSAGQLSSGWSVGTVGEGFLTSSTGCSWGWDLEFCLHEGLDCLEIVSTLNHLGLEFSSVCIVGLDLTGEYGSVQSVLSVGDSVLSIADIADQSIKCFLLNIPFTFVSFDLSSECNEIGTAESSGESIFSI